MPIFTKIAFNEPLMLTMLRTDMNDPDKLAKAFTNQYVKAVLQGLPGGLPTPFPATLPAPGLSTPSGPPPYPIAPNAVPINNFESRKRRMEQILRLHFRTRQLAQQNSSIKGIKKNIKTSLKIINDTNKDIQVIIRQAKILATEVKKLPQLIEDLKIAAEVIAKKEIGLITRLVDGLNEFSFAFTPEDTAVVNIIKNFTQDETGARKDFSIKTLINSLQDIVYLIDTIEFVLESIPITSVVDDSGLKRPEENLLVSNSGPYKPIEVFDPNSDPSFYGYSSQDLPQTATTNTQQVQEEPGFNFAEAGQVTGIPRESSLSPQGQLNPQPQQQTSTPNTTTSVVEIVADDPFRIETENVRKYIYRQLLESVKGLFSLVNCVASPLEYIGFFRDLANFDKEYESILKILEKYELVFIFAKPLVQKLYEKYEQKRLKLKATVNEVVVVQKRRLQKKMQEKLSRKTAPGVAEQRRDKIKFARKLKEKWLDRARLAKYITTDVLKILKKIQTINKNRLFLQKEIEYELEVGLALYMQKLAAASQDTTTGFAFDVNNPGSVGLSYPSLKYSQIREGRLANSFSVGNSQLLLSQSLSSTLDYNPSLAPTSQIYSAGGYIQGMSNDYSALSGTDPAKIDETIYKVLTDLGINAIPSVRDILTKNITTVKFDSPYPIYRFFLTESDRYVALSRMGKQLAQDVNELVQRVKFLVKNIRPLNDAKNYVRIDDPRNRIKRQEAFKLDKTERVSLRTIIKDVQDNIEPELLKLLEDVKSVFTTVKNSINQWLRKRGQEIADFLLQLIPVSPSIKDRKSKAELLKYRKQKFKNIVKKIKRTVKYIRSIARVFKGFRSFIITNLIVNKQYRYDVNAQAIDDMIDSLFELKILRATDKDVKLPKNAQLGETRIAGIDDGSVERKLTQTRDTIKTDIRVLLSYLEYLVDLIKEIGAITKSNPDESSPTNVWNSLKVRIELEWQTTDFGVDPSLDDITRLEYKEYMLSLPERLKILFGEIESTYNSAVSTAQSSESFNSRAKALADTEQGSIYSTYRTSMEFLEDAKKRSGNYNLTNTTEFRDLITRWENEFLGTIKEKYNAFSRSQIRAVATEQSGSYVNQLRERDEALELRRKQLARLADEDSDAFYDTKATPVPEITKRSKYYATISKLIPSKPFEESIILMAIDGLVWIFQELQKWLSNLWKKYIHPEFKSVEKEKERAEEEAREETRKQTKQFTPTPEENELRFHFPRALNKATKAFWLGFKWYAPDGTQFICTNIPPIKPLRDPKTKKPVVPVDGLKGWIEATGNALFEEQLFLMSGILTPPRQTQIVPIKFKGYK